MFGKFAWSQLQDHLLGTDEHEALGQYHSPSVMSETCCPQMSVSGREREPWPQPRSGHSNSAAPGFRTGLEVSKIRPQFVQRSRGRHRPRCRAGKAASHAGQTALYLTPIHGKAMHSPIADRDYPRGSAACQARCRAVQANGPVGNADALRLRQNCGGPRTVHTSRCPAGDGATAGLRFSRV
jgi:hypothetical protein